MSKLRPECVDGKGAYSPPYETALLGIYHAVKHQDGLIAGKLDGLRGEHCAIGSYFAEHPQSALETALIDEVALVNDSIRGTHKYRRREMLRWLRWKLEQAGVPLPGRKASPPKGKCDE